MTQEELGLTSLHTDQASTLKRLRRLKKWTLEQASERIGVSVGTLSRWEQGTQSPHGYNLQGLCDAYEITESELVGKEQSMGEQRLRLMQARADRHWTQVQVAVQIGVDVCTYSKWERGTITPHPGNIQQLCDVFACSDVELGFHRDLLPASPTLSPLEFDIVDEARCFLTDDLTMRLLTLALSSLDAYSMQREVIKQLDMNKDSLTRREALRRLATLPIAALHLNATVPTLAAQPGTILSQCSAGVVACWALRKGKELSLANSAVSAYIPSLKEIVATSSHHRKAAADVLVQCYLLKTALSWHITTPTDGIAYTQQAETYSQIAEKPILQVAALRAQAAVHCYANQWEQALHAGMQAKYLLDTTPKELIPPLARSYVYAGIATYQAYHQQKQDALTSLKKAHATFFEQSDDDAQPLWVDHNIGNLLINDGLTHSHLGLYKGAMDSFAQIEQRAIHDTTISFDGTIEAQIGQVMVEVSRDDCVRDMDRSIALWTQGIAGAKSIQSNKHYGDALVAYTTMKAAWPSEQRIKALRELTLHW